MNLTSEVGPLQSTATGNCAGCYTLPRLDGPLPLEAFFQFEVVGGMPAVNDGAFVVMTFDFADPAFGVNDFISAVNGLSAEAFDINYSPNPTCSFADFLDPGVYNASNTVVFRWVATAGQSVFTFGWDFSFGASFGQAFPGMTVTGAGGVPAPGASGLFAASGLLASRRRRTA